MADVRQPLFFDSSRVRRFLDGSFSDDRDLNIIHLNARSISAHFSDIHNILFKSNIHVCAVSETFLKTDSLCHQFLIPGYQIIRNDRTHKGGGGVAFYIQDQFKFKLVRQSDPGSVIEYLFIELLFSSMKVLVGVFYNPPPSSNKINKLNDFLPEILSKYSHAIFLGDFNINLLKPSAEVKRFKSVARSLSLDFLDLNPTCHSAISSVSSLIDLILVNNRDYVTGFGQLPVSGISEHDLIFLSYRAHFPKVPLKSKLIKDFKNMNPDLIRTQATALDWDSIYLQSTSNDKLSVFYNNLNVILSEIPTKRIFSSPNGIPWYNISIKYAELDRDRAYNLWLRTREPNDRKVFCYFRNKVTLLKRHFKGSYFKHKLTTLHNDPKTFYTNLNNLISSKNDSVKPTLSPDEFNEYFCTSANTPASGIVFNSQGSPHEDSLPELCFRCIESEELLNSLSHVKSNAIGSDGVPRNLILILLPIIFPFILHIFNFIITSSEYPSAWKKSTVLPIPKTKIPSKVSDFRPIGTLPFLSKCFEHCLKKQMDPFIYKNRLLNKFQSGFRSHYGTDPALLRVFNDLSLSLDQNKISILILLDFSKAFDSVNHTLLLQKLSGFFKFSVLACKLLGSYLSNRCQSVSYSDKLSSERPISQGVVQGSILSTVLFSVLINDLPKVLQHCLYMIFADDFQFYISGYISEIDTLYAKLNEDFNAISRWAGENGLTLNINKTQAILFSKSPAVVPPLILNNIEIPFTKTVKNLGVTFDSSLNWDHHIGSVCGRIYGTLNRLYQVRECLSEHVRLKIVKSLIIPHILYGSCLFWNCKSKYLCKLRKAVNSCTRFVFDIPARERLGDKRNAILGMSLNNFLKFRTVSSLFKIITFQQPDYLFQLLNFFKSSRTPRNIVIPRSQSRYYHNSFFVAGVKLWNTLPNDIKTSKTVHVFRNSARGFFTNR